MMIDMRWLWSMLLGMALSALFFNRQSLAAQTRGLGRRVLVWKTMRRRFENQRLTRLNSVGDGMHSQFMWKKSVFGSESESESDASADNAAPDGLMQAQKKLVMVMVGLPARGKSFVVQKAMHYIEWLGFPTKIFNVGNFRRKIGKAGEDADFFSAENVDAKNLREDMAMEVLDELIQWLEDKGHVGVFDATNTTRLRRYGIGWIDYAMACCWCIDGTMIFAVE